MACLFCGQPLTGSTCSFHPGHATRAFSTGVDPRGMEMSYRDIYSWSCCGARVPSTVLEDQGRIAEKPPPRSPGCVISRTHRTSAGVALIFDRRWEPLAACVAGTLTGMGIELNRIDSKQYDASQALEADCIAFLVGECGPAAAATAAETLREIHPNLPIVIFSDPERIDGWRLQALSSERLTPDMAVDAILDALRSTQTPPERWRPRVFVSYTRRDSGRVSVIAGELSHLERDCWLDSRLLRPGVDWSTEIETGIAQSDLFLLLVTDNTPPNSYSWLELSIARKAGKPVFVYGEKSGVKKYLQSPDAAGRRLRRCSVTPSPHHRFDAIDEVLFDSTPPHTVVFRSWNHNVPEYVRLWDVRFLLQYWGTSNQPRFQRRSWLASI